MYDNSFPSRNPLLVADLFRCILDCLITSLPQRLSREERRTLAVLARTCRAFSEPSLNILWQRLNSLLPLVQCFAGIADEIRVKTPPSPLEWLAVNRYSHRIQDLTLGDEPLSLHFVQHAGLALPNLRVFRWRSPAARGFATSPEFSPESIAFVWPLLTSSLVTIDAQFSHSGDPNYQLFLETYPHLCPNLESIKIDFVFETQDHTTVPQALSRAICGNAHWRHVDLSPPIDSTVLKHLGACSTLKTVSLAIAPQTMRLNEDFFGPEDTPFRDVSDFSLSLSDPLDSVACLLLPDDQAFNAVSVTLHNETIQTEVSAFLEAVASPRRIHSLQSFHLTTSSPLPTDGHHPVLSYEAFRPLVSLTYLRRLDIGLNHSASLDDDEFSGLVRHWPLLERLRMTWVPAEHPVASVTLKGLLSLLTSCRRLRAIDLTLDARDVPVVGTGADVCSSSVIYPIMFRHSPLEHPESVAAFLSKHVPSAPGVYSSFSWDSTQGKCSPITLVNNPKESEYQRLWGQVNKHMGRRASARLLNAS